MTTNNRGRKIEEPSKTEKTVHLNPSLEANNSMAYLENDDSNEESDIEIENLREETLIKESAMRLLCQTKNHLHLIGIICNLYGQIFELVSEISAFLILRRAEDLFQILEGKPG